MPKKNKIDQDVLKFKITSHLKKAGKSSVIDLKKIFNISQSTISRLFSDLKGDVLYFGKARKSIYAHAKKIVGDVYSFPIYEINETAQFNILGILYAIYPNEFYFSSHDETKIKSSFYPDIPYFLNDMRPTGFLGRLIPIQNKDLHLPTDIKLWHSEHCINYLIHRGWNCIGNLITGDKSLHIYLESLQTHKNNEQNFIYKNFISSNTRKTKYPMCAHDVLLHGEPGSSAGGEQPKFLATITPANIEVLVKFSPSVNTKIGRRVSDILICEHIALQLLNSQGYIAAQTELIESQDQIFLQVRRFDRINSHGRKGMISLASLDAQFTGVVGTWIETAHELHKNKIITEEHFKTIRFLQTFGNLIANSDMHLYNFSFFMKDFKVVECAPVYDMCPMLFMPTNNTITDKIFTPVFPNIQNRDVWPQAVKIALMFWKIVLKNELISKDFLKIAKNCESILTEYSQII